MHTVMTDKQQRVRLPDAKPGQVFAYEVDPTGSIITLHQVKKVEADVEVLDIKDVNPRTFMPKDGSKITRESILAAIRADREGKQ
jgi:hypothetical protein